MENEKPKELIIDNVVYAKYLIEEDIVYMKMLKEIIPGDGMASENDLIQKISILEGKKFSHAAYLNI